MTQPLELGRSLEGRPILGCRFGEGGARISLIGGCHADEPVGPRLLRGLVAHLAGASPTDGALPPLPPRGELLRDREWWIVPHVNPDGEERNRAWQEDDDGAEGAGAEGAGRGPEAYDLSSYLAHAVRELPGDDIEFGFPEGPGDRGGNRPDRGGTQPARGGDRPDRGGTQPDRGGPRPENLALHDWWRGADGAFHFHASLHGMGFAAGPWLLIEPTWAERARPLRESFGREVEDLGYELHDVERLGEKGFFRLGRGFATRPDSRHMRDHFLARGDRETAALFRPSSMEAIRTLAEGVPGADPLTLVTEMPLFLTPGVGKELGPPDPVSEEWKARIAGWRQDLEDGAPPDRIRDEAARAGLRPMPVTSQMALQWAAIAGALELVG